MTNFFKAITKNETLQAVLFSILALVVLVGGFLITCALIGSAALFVYPCVIIAVGMVASIYHSHKMECAQFERRACRFA